MGLFSRKRKILFSEIIDSLLIVLNDACEMQQLRQIQSLESFMDTKTGAPIVKRLKIGNQEIEIPLVLLASHDSMEIKEVNVSFQVRIKDLKHGQLSSIQWQTSLLLTMTLEFMLDKIEGKEDVFAVNITLK